MRRLRSRFGKSFARSRLEKSPTNRPIAKTASIETDQILDHPWFGLSLVVTQETLYKAIEQVELLTAWMEEPLFDVKHGRR